MAEDALVQRPLPEFPPLGGPEAVGHEVVEGAGVVAFKAGGGAEEGIPVQLKRKLVAEGLRGAAVIQGVLKALQCLAVFRFPGVPCVKLPQPLPWGKVVAVGAQLLRKAGNSPLRAYGGSGSRSVCRPTFGNISRILSTSGAGRAASVPALMV